MLALPRLDGADPRQDPSLAPAPLADALHSQGVCWIAGWPDAQLCTALRDDLFRLRAARAFSAAVVGRDRGRRLREDIRGDHTCWLDDPRCGPAARDFLARLDSVRIALNRSLFLGLRDVEAHYAVYPPGAGYARHRDRFRDSDARVVSWVTYLNLDWGDDDGGALRIHRSSADAQARDSASDDAGHTTSHEARRDTRRDAWDIAPQGGSVCFLSELEHEVLPARRERSSIAAWFRRDGGIGRV